MGNKHTKGKKRNNNKTVVFSGESTDNEKIVWAFDMIDKDGLFAFDINRADFKINEVMDKIISYSTMTWSEVKSQTHDNGKSKNHMIDIDGFSGEAKKRFEFKEFQEYSDSVFSFALQNKLRIIGIRKGRVFHVVWYDPNHEFYPTRTK